MPKPRASLKGLGARLQAEAATEVVEHPLDAFGQETHQVIHIHLDAITPNPEQPRKHFAPAALEELAQSIRDHGILQPVIVKRRPGEGYLLVAGERRLRAARIAGLRKLPALVTEGDELELGIVENLQREDLRPIEEAEGLHALSGRFGYTQEQLAGVIGKSRVSVAESLSLLSLPDEMREECRTSDIASKSQLLQVVRERDAEKRAALWAAIKAGGLTVREARGRRKKAPGRGRPKSFTQTFRIEEPAASVTVKFRAASVPPEQVAAVLRLALEEQEKTLAPKG